MFCFWCFFLKKEPRSLVKPSVLARYFYSWILPSGPSVALDVGERVSRKEWRGQRRKVGVAGGLDRGGRSGRTDPTRLKGEPSESMTGDGTLVYETYSRGDVRLGRKQKGATLRDLVIKFHKGKTGLFSQFKELAHRMRRQSVTRLTVLVSGPKWRCPTSRSTERRTFYLSLWFFSG